MDNIENARLRKEGADLEDGRYDSIKGGDTFDLNAEMVSNLQQAQQIPIEFIYPNPYQLRTNSVEIGIDELASSIKAIGVLEPLLVVRKGRRRFLLIDGHRRLEAAKRATIAKVPCILLDLSDEEILQYSLIENLQRTDLTPFEEAAAIRQLIGICNLTYREIAVRIGKSAGFVSERLALLDLPADVKEAVVDGRLSVKKGLELAKIPIERIRRKLATRGGEGDLEQFKMLIQEEIAHRMKRKKSYDKWNILPELRDFAKNNSQIRIFKDRLSLKYESPERLKVLLGELIKVLDSIETK